MASLAESVASVPMPDLAALQERLLEHREPLHSVPQAETDSDNRVGNNVEPRDTNQHTCESESGAIAESANAYCNHTTSPETRRPPRLSSSKSAPPAEMEAMLQPSPSQQAFRDMTRAESFHGYPGGDTQPIESQVYRDYTESMLKPSTTPKKPIYTVKVSPDGKFTYDTAATDKTPHTYVEGESGFVDIMQEWDQPSPTPRSQSDIEELLVSPQTQTHVSDDVAPRPTMPETPSMAGHKRSRSGEILTSATASTKKTPGISQLFGAAPKGPVMSNTQLFDQTQAPSSPMLDAPRSDPVVSRPSPNIMNTTTYDQSSPMGLASSPEITLHRPSSAFGEPRDKYTSMRESQEKRATALRQEIGLPMLADEYEDEEDSQRRRIEHKRMQRVLSDRALSDFAKFRAPPRPDSRPTSSRKQVATIDLVTPARPADGGRVEFEISDDDDDTDDEAPLNEEDDGSPVAQEDVDNDVYDELGQTVLRSQRDNLDEDGEDAQDPVVNREHLESSQNEENEETADEELPDTYVSQPRDHTSQLQEHQIMGATQPSAIADSQPGVGAPGTDHKQLAERSSLSSFVPGSQYIGKTTQEQAHSSRRGDRHPPTNNVNETVPSSPPVRAEDDTLPEASTDLSNARRSAQQHFQSTAAPLEADSHHRQEIPESDIMTSDDAQLATTDSAMTGKVTSNGESESVPVPFSTAQTHLSASGPSPRKAHSASDKSPFKTFVSQQSKMSADSPRKAAGVRHFADIAADPSPAVGTGQTQEDVDAVMSDVMTAEDQEFIEAMSAPAATRTSKRRKLRHGASVQAISSERPVEKRLKKTVLDEEPPAERQAEEREQAPDTRLQDNRPVDMPSTVLQSSPSKANELPVAEPNGAESPKGTQESVRKREQAGAQVSQLLSNRTAKPPKVAKRRGSDSTNATPEVREPMRKRSGFKLKLSASSTRKGSTESAQPTPGNVQREGPMEIATAAAPLNHLADDVHAEMAETADVFEITAPHRVFALFKGTYNNFYPATWLSTSADGKSYSIKFEDQNVTDIDLQHVRALDMRVGDVVKVDGVGMRGKTWIVQSFGRASNLAQDQAIGTDVYGRTTIRVQAKVSRKSLPTSDPALQADGEVIEVLVSNVYLTHTLWPSFTDRTFTPPETDRRGANRFATPSTGVQTPDAQTPTSRTRRSVVPATKAAVRKTSHLREGYFASRGCIGHTGLFDGMAFAISYVGNESQKAEVTQQILLNGGMILETGFDALFESPSLDDVTTVSPSKRSPTKNVNSTALKLKPEYADLGFVALVADHHSRRTKYMQALALGLPTISGRWITDCLNARKNDAAAAPLSWSKYLLPAGESAYLHGAVRSRTLAAYDAAEAKLADTISNCELLLDGEGVVIVAPKKAKVSWERRKPYAFLSLALGAGDVKRVHDLQEAKELTDDANARWKWIYVDGSVAEASSLLDGNNAKKRKRDDDVRNADVTSMSAGNGNVKVVNDEFVVQSLILGALVD